MAGTPFDFRAPHTIGSRINEDNEQLLIAQGYDHNWVLNKTGPTLDGLRLAAHALGPRGGRELTVWTDQPGGSSTPAGHLTLHLPESWHREQEWLSLLTAACGPPAAAA